MFQKIWWLANLASSQKSAGDDPLPINYDNGYKQSVTFYEEDTLPFILDDL
jgi:hypothetical protein